MENFDTPVIEPALFLRKDYQYYKQLKWLETGNYFKRNFMVFQYFFNSDFRLFLKGIIGT